MISLILRLIKRLLVLSAGLLVVYLAVWKFFPFFDHQIPVALALLTTYIFTAYIFVPACIRGFRYFFRPNHIPLYCVTPDGFASDPINIGLVGTRSEIIRAMRSAGWSMPDKKNLRSLIKVLKAIIIQKPYPHTPFSSLYLFGHKQDLGFALPIDGSSSKRHHVRFWACNFDGPEAFDDHVRFWQRFHRPHRIDEHRQFWVGAASRDIGLIPIRHNAQLTHAVDPDTNAERDFIVATLKDKKLVSNTRVIKVGAPYELRNRTIGGLLRTDGKMTILTIKS